MVSVNHHHHHPLAANAARRVDQNQLAGANRVFLITGSSNSGKGSSERDFEFGKNSSSGSSSDGGEKGCQSSSDDGKATSSDDGKSSENDGSQEGEKAGKRVAGGIQARDDSSTAYRDFSQVPAERKTEQVSVAAIAGTALNPQLVPKESTFPVKLHQILLDPRWSDTIAWLPHGRSWRILKQEKFEQKVIPTYFRHGRYSSFNRQVNGWGFRRFLHGRDNKSYYHELFLRGVPHLCDRMRRLTTKGIAKRKTEGEVPAPDLYAFSRDNALAEAPAAASTPTSSLMDTLAPSNLASSTDMEIDGEIDVLRKQHAEIMERINSITAAKRPRMDSITAVKAPAQEQQPAPQEPPAAILPQAQTNIQGQSVDVSPLLRLLSSISSSSSGGLQQQQQQQPQPNLASLLSALIETPLVQAPISPVRSPAAINNSGTLLQQVTLALILGQGAGTTRTGQPNTANTLAQLLQSLTANNNGNSHSASAPN